MAYYDTDEALQEIHDEMYSGQEDQKKTGLAAMDTGARTWVAIFFGAIAFMVYLEKITLRNGAILAAIGAIILYMIGSGTPKRKELTWLECQIRVYDLLDFLQAHPIGKYPQIPPGEIRVTPVGRKQWYEGQGFKRSFGVNIYDSNKDVENMYFVEIDIFNGDIITFREAPEGVRGDETKDIKLMPSYGDLILRKREQFMGKNLSKP